MGWDGWRRGKRCQIGIVVAGDSNPGGSGSVELDQDAVGVACVNAVDFSVIVGEGLNGTGKLKTLGNQVLGQGFHILYAKL